jgi:quercetin dioxygenase-like cupin family protein
MTAPVLQSSEIDLAVNSLTHDASPSAKPGAIRYADVRRVIWGDSESGEVADWVYASTHHIHQLLFGLPPGGSFRHSAELRTVFAADIVYFVLGGTLVLNNPETGECRLIQTGEAAFFRRDTWHHGHNLSTAPLRVLEYFAPPPLQGTSRKYARTRPNLTDVQTTQDEWLGRWPTEASTAQRDASLRVLRDTDALIRLEGSAQQLLVELFVSTEHLTAGRMTLLPGRRTDARRYGGDLALYVCEGSVFVRSEFDGEQTVSEISARDGFYLPAGSAIEFHIVGDAPCRMLFGVAPQYVNGE